MHDLTEGHYTGCRMKNIVILISGRGSNMEAIVQACATENWSARVAAVVSNKATASGLQFAAQQGIATAALDHKQFDSREAFDDELMKVIDGFAPDVVVLAGFMRILTEGFVRHYEGRLINIHPSLLPAFPGLHTHERALEAGCKVAGATVHLVTPALDHGPIIAQAVVPVLPTDTPDTLAERVLVQEHQIYPRAVRWLVEGALSVSSTGIVTIQGDGEGDVAQASFGA
jgi:phosphoribosylglycinamide formyltransferase-1